MQRKLRELIIVVMAVFCICNFRGSSKGVGDNPKEEDYTYEVLEDGTVSITGYVGHDSELHMPDVIKGKTVTAIGEKAFDSNLEINKVYLPKGLKRIGLSAFGFCYNLKYVDMPNGLEVIEVGAFIACGFEEIYIPNSVKSIERVAFDGCELKSIRIPDGITCIANATFRDCEKLESVYIPKTVRCIEREAFDSCKNLTCFCSDGVEYKNSQFTIIPINIERIESFVFSSCNSIKNLVVLNANCKISTQYLDVNIYGYQNSTASTYAYEQNLHFYEFKPQNRMTLSNTSLQLFANKKKTASIKINGLSDSTIKEVVWSSNNTKVVKVDENGTITAISPGQAVISARTIDGSMVTKTCNVTVGIEATSLKLNKIKLTLSPVGNKLARLSATVAPSNTSNKKIYWRSSNIKVAQIDGNGNVSAKSPGVVKITASCGSVTSTCTVTVVPDAVKNFRASNQDESTITIKWSKVSGASGYQLYRYDTKQKKYISVANIKSNMYKLKRLNGSKGKKLEGGTYYKLKIVPYKIVGNKNIYGKDSKVNTPTAPEKSKITKLKKTYSKGKYGIKVTWKSVKGATGYKLYMSTKKNGKYKCIKTTKGKNSTTYTKNGILRGKTYYFKVQVLKSVSKKTINSKQSLRAWIRVK